MDFMPFCQWLSETTFSRNLREAPYPFPVLIIVHIITIALFGGMVVMGNLRVLGWSIKSVPVSQVIGQFRPWKWTAFGLLLVSGTLLAMSDPVEYGGNIMFWISNALLKRPLIDCSGVQQRKLGVTQRRRRVFALAYPTVESIHEIRSGSVVHIP